MFETWFLAVRGLIPSSSAISAFSIPCAMSRRTSSSRAESSCASSSSASWLLLAPPDASKHDLGRARRQPRRALDSRTDGDRHPVNRSVLRQEAARAGTDDGGDVRVLGGDRQRDDASRGIAVEDLARRLGALEVGHPDVHQHDIGSELVGESNAHASAGRLGDHLDIRL